LRKADAKEWKNKSIKNVTLDEEELEGLNFLDLDEMLEIYRSKYIDYEDRRYVFMCVCVYVCMCVCVCVCFILTAIRKQLTNKQSIANKERREEIKKTKPKIPPTRTLRIHTTTTTTQQKADEEEEEEEVMQPKRKVSNLNDCAHLCVIIYYIGTS
jgi:hypothetical protein